MNVICCRTSVYPLDLKTAVSILTVGLFKPVYWLPNRPDVAVNWERAIPEEGTVVNASLSEDSLELNLSPAISVFAHHLGKRLTASVYFEIAAKYAEKVGGEIIQGSNVVGCSEEPGVNNLLIAHYPEMPLQFSRICEGFRALILGET